MHCQRLPLVVNSPLRLPTRVAFDHGLIAYKGCIAREQADILEYSTEGIYGYTGQIQRRGTSVKRHVQKKRNSLDRTHGQGYWMKDPDISYNWIKCRGQNLVVTEASSSK